MSKYIENAYVECITFFEDFNHIFTFMEVVYKNIWKPCQIDVLISSYEFILTSKFSQDCLGNLFSVFRSKQVVPNSVQVENKLEAICFSQYLKNASKSSYEDDDREHLSGFFRFSEDNKYGLWWSGTSNWSKRPTIQFVLQWIKNYALFVQVLQVQQGPHTKKFTKLTLLKKFC